MAGFTVHLMLLAIAVLAAIAGCYVSNSVRVPESGC